MLLDVRSVCIAPVTDVPRVSFERVIVNAYSVGPSDGLLQEAPPSLETSTRNSKGLVNRPKVNASVEFEEKTIQ
jgi:hypothetical protein